MLLRQGLQDVETSISTFYRAAFVALLGDHMNVAKSCLTITIGLFLASCGSGNKATLLECKIRDDVGSVIVEKDRIILKFQGNEKVYDRAPHYKDYSIEEDGSLIDLAAGRKVFVRGFIFRRSGNLWINDAYGTHNGAKPELIEGQCSKFDPKV